MRGTVYNLPFLRQNIIYGQFRRLLIAPVWAAAAFHFSSRFYRILHVFSRHSLLDSSTVNGL